MIVLLLAGVGALAGGSGLDEKEVAAARKTYVAKCAKCHKFYEPKNYTEPDWEKWMDSMSRKSRLKTEQDKLLRAYLEEYRAGRIAKIPK